jgi:putative copper resistance protein D
MAGPAALILARWVFFTAAMVAFGSALFPFYAFKSSERGARTAKAAIVAVVAALVTLISAIAWFVLLTIDFGGDDWPSFLSTANTMLFETSFGPLWLIRFAAALALVLVVTLWPRRPAVLVVATVVLGSEAWIGHLAAGGVVHCAIQTFHILPAGAWLGGLVPLSLFLAQGRRERIGADRAFPVLTRFSAMGIVSVGLIALTGIVNTAIVLGRVPGFSTDYGLTLLIKIALFIVLVLVAAFNRLRLLPRLVDQRGPDTTVLRLLWRTVLVEQALGVAVLLAASVLGLADPGA